MVKTVGAALASNFLGAAPAWYKLAVLGFLILNPLLLFAVGPYVAGWALIGEFILTLALALKCYPLTAGGLLALQAVILGLTTPEAIYAEVAHNLPVLLLLIFMVAGIHFMKDLLRLVFTRLLVRVRSKMYLSLLFLLLGAVLSAFLDALTVAAVMITVAYGFYDLYHRHVSARRPDQGRDARADAAMEAEQGADLGQFRGFLRNLMMHGAVGTALGGVMTLVGEPQNLLIGHELGWDFATFFRPDGPGVAAGAGGGHRDLPGGGALRAVRLRPPPARLGADPAGGAGARGCRDPARLKTGPPWRSWPWRRRRWWSPWPCIWPRWA